MAAPAAAPAIMPSVSGVSSTRFSPYLANRPSVAPKTPPFLPTSSPSTITLGSRSSSSSMAVRIASRMFSSAMSGALLVGVDVELRRGDVRIGSRFRPAAGLIDDGFGLRPQLVLALVGEQPPLAQLGGEASDRV